MKAPGKLAVSLAAGLAALLAVDAGFRLRAKPAALAYSGDFRIVPDPLLGFKPAPDQRAESVVAAGSRVLRAVYSIDRFGRRVVPGQRSERRTRPLIFFGGSYAFGDQVADDQTLPYYVSRLATGFRVYNYGFLAWGPQNMLALLEKADLRRQIPENGAAVGVYVLIGDHVRRAVPTLSWEIMMVPNSLPYFAPDASGRLEWRGSFAHARPLTSALYRLLGKSGLVRHYGLDWPPISRRDFELTARIIEESRRAFKAQFGSDRFYVVAFPSWHADYEQEVVSLLEKDGVRCLNYSARDMSKEIGGPVNSADFHPVPKVYETAAGWIVRDLGAGRPSPGF